MAFKKFLEKNKGIIIGTTVILAISISLGAFFMNKHKTDKIQEISQGKEMMVADNILSTTRNGQVYLYKTKDGKEVNVFDLKSLSKGKETVEKKVVKEEKKVTPKPQKPINTSPEYYKGYKKVEVTIKKGDNDWNIQKSLTPNESVEKMLEMVKEVNNKKSLDLVYPGEKYVFLANPNGQTVPVVEETKPEENVVEETIVEEKVVEEKVFKKLGEDAVYIYSPAKDFTSLYAYNDVEKTFYKISEKSDKIIVDEIMKNDKISNFEEYRVDDKNIFTKDKNENSITKIDDKNNLKKFVLKGKPEFWDAYKNNIFYIIDKQLYKIDAESGKETCIQLGDKSRNMMIVDGNLYIQNMFGENNQKAVVYKINPDNLDVFGWYELNSNTNRVYTASISDKNIYISQIKQDKVTTKALLIGVKTEKLETIDKVDNVKMNPSGITKNNCLYVSNGNDYSVLDTRSGSELNKVKVKGEFNIPID